MMKGLELELKLPRTIAEQKKIEYWDRLMKVIARLEKPKEKLIAAQLMDALEPEHPGALPSSLLPPSRCDLPHPLGDVVKELMAHPEAEAVYMVESADLNTASLYTITNVLDGTLTSHVIRVEEKWWGVFDYLEIRAWYRRGRALEDIAPRCTRRIDIKEDHS
jgi:hypothetical protein